MAVISGAIREFHSHVRHPFQEQIVEYDEFVVAAGNDVLFKKISTHAESQRFSRNRMFGEVRAGAPVGNDQRPGFKLRPQLPDAYA